MNTMLESISLNFSRVSSERQGAILELKSDASNKFQNLNNSMKSNYKYVNNQILQMNNSVLNKIDILHTSIENETLQRTISNNFIHVDLANIKTKIQSLQDSTYRNITININNIQSIQQNIADEKVYTSKTREILRYNIQNETNIRHQGDIYINRSITMLNDTWHDKYNTLNLNIQMNYIKLNKNILNVKLESRSMLQNESIRAIAVESSMQDDIIDIKRHARIIESSIPSNTSYIENKVLNSVKSDLQIINSTIDILDKKHDIQYSNLNSSMLAMNDNIKSSILEEASRAKNVENDIMQSIKTTKSNLTSKILLVNSTLSIDIQKQAVLTHSLLKEDVENLRKFINMSVVNNYNKLYTDINNTAVHLQVETIRARHADAKLTLRLQKTNVDFGKPCR